MQPLTILTRSNYIESIHYGDICITDSSNKQLFNIGDTDTKIYLRSTAKPFQAVPIVDSGAIEKFNITLEELAIICASHSGQDFHREAVSSILSKIGLNENHLDCGVSNPYNQDMIDDIIRKGEKPSKLYNNCSGLHAGMLTLCRYYDFPVVDYIKADHPVQKLILKVFEELLECSEKDIILGIDGCGVPTYMVTMKQAAYLYSLLAQGVHGKNRHRNSLDIIRKAMAAYPHMINGDKEFCTELILFSKGKAIGKVGAEGIYCIAVPEKQLGISIKISDGRERGIYPAAIHILSQLGVLDDEAMEKLKVWAYPPLKNHRGELTGYAIPVFDISKIGSMNSFEIGMKYKLDG